VKAAPIAAALALVAGAAQAAFDANGVVLGSNEQQVKQYFPAARCRPLEWPSRAAERRCDDSRITFAGIEARVTFYLRRDAVEGFDVRFRSGDFERVTNYLTTRYGKPADASNEKLRKLEWKAQGERAELSLEDDKRRGSLFVWRGDFSEEIYKVR
jgi:hypothetical protein